MSNIFSNICVGEGRKGGEFECYLYNEECKRNGPILTIEFDSLYLNTL